MTLSELMDLLIHICVSPCSLRFDAAFISRWCLERTCAAQLACGTWYAFVVVGVCDLWNILVYVWLVINICCGCWL